MSISSTTSLLNWNYITFHYIYFSWIHSNKKATPKIIFVKHGISWLTCIIWNQEWQTSFPIWRVSQAKTRNNQHCLHIISRWFLLQQWFWTIKINSQILDQHIIECLACKWLFPIQKSVHGRELIIKHAIEFLVKLTPLIWRNPLIHLFKFPGKDFNSHWRESMQHKSL